MAKKDVRMVKTAWTVPIQNSTVKIPAGEQIEIERVPHLRIFWTGFQTKQLGLSAGNRGGPCQTHIIRLRLRSGDSCCTWLGVRRNG